MCLYPGAHAQGNSFCLFPLRAGKQGPWGPWDPRIGLRRRVRTEEVCLEPFWKEEAGTALGEVRM